MAVFGTLFNKTPLQVAVTDGNYAEMEFYVKVNTYEHNLSDSSYKYHDFKIEWSYLSYVHSILSKNSLVKKIILVH